MESEHVVTANDGTRLAGTLVRPEGADAVVLMIHGSGPLDRNENLLRQSLNVFNTIAADLAERGIASFRYDKRGCGKSTGDYYTAGYHDVVDDAAACLAFLKEHASGGFHRVILLGHSEGTLVAADVAGTHESVDGLVLLSPFLQPIEDILIAQGREIGRALAEMPGLGGSLARLSARLFGPPLAAQKRLISRVKASDAPVVQHNLQRFPAKSLRELMAVDPAAIYGKVGVPTLVVSGGKDLQCDPGDGERIADLIGPQATSVLMPNLTHILRQDPGEHTFLSYQRLIRQPIDKALLGEVGGWLERMTRE